MKKTYEKPFAQKVAFSYQDQVTAESGGHVGQIYNRDHTGHCQHTNPGCNDIWHVNGGISIASMDDCKIYLG